MTGCFAFSSLSRPEEMPAHFRRVRGETFLKEIERREGGGAGDGVSTVGASVTSGVPLEKLVSRHDGRERHSRSDALREHQDVGLEVEVLGGE